jgi:enoyl-CoA hydratase
MYQHIIVQIEAGILTLTINRESKLNALNIELLGEIDHALTAQRDNAAVQGVVITGSGNKAFAAGADIAEFAHFTAEQGKQLSTQRAWHI